LETAGQKDYRGFGKAYEKLLKLEEVRQQMHTHHTPQNEFKDDVPNIMPNIRRVKRFLGRAAAKTGW